MNESPIVIIEFQQKHLLQIRSEKYYLQRKIADIGIFQEDELIMERKYMRL